MLHFHKLGRGKMKKQNNENKVSNNLIKRMDAIISILLNQKTIEKLNQTEKINFLTKIGFKNNEIASILGITLENVKASKYRKRNKK